MPAHRWRTAGAPLTPRRGPCCVLHPRHPWRRCCAQMFYPLPQRFSSSGRSAFLISFLPTHRWSGWMWRSRASRWGASRWCSSPTSAPEPQRTCGEARRAALGCAAGLCCPGSGVPCWVACAGLGCCARHALRWPPACPPGWTAHASAVHHPTRSHTCRCSPHPPPRRQLCTGESGVVPTEPAGKEGAGKARHIKGAYFYRIIDQASRFSWWWCLCVCVVIGGNAFGAGRPPVAPAARCCPAGECHPQQLYHVFFPPAAVY